MEVKKTFSRSQIGFLISHSQKAWDGNGYYHMPFYFKRKEVNGERESEFEILTYEQLPDHIKELFPVSQEANEYATKVLDYLILNQLTVTPERIFDVKSFIKEHGHEF